MKVFKWCLASFFIIQCAVVIVAMLAMAAKVSGQCPPGVECPTTPIMPKPELKSPYVRVESRTTIGRRIETSKGSGTVIHIEDGQAWILTAAHVVEKRPTATAIWFRGGVATGDVLGKDFSTDIAVFKVPAPPGATALHVLEEDASLEVGTPIDLLGYPGGRFKEVQGRFLRLTQYGCDCPRHQGAPQAPKDSGLAVSGLVLGGTSGGAMVVTTTKGRRLAGVIATGKDADTEGCGHIHIRKLLRITAPVCLRRRARKPPAEDIADDVPPIIEIPGLDEPALEAMPEQQPTRDKTPFWVLLAGALTLWPTAGGLAAWKELKKTG